MQKRWLIIFAGLAVTAVLLWRQQIRTSTALATLKHSCDDLRLHLETNDRFLAQLQSSLDQLTKPAGTLASDSSITQQLDSLALSQSNTLALLQKLAARTTASQPAVNGAERTAAALTVLQASLNDQQQKLDVARQRASDLLRSLNVPPEIATMDPSVGLDTAALKAYWPFFESRREREILQAQTDRLRLRIIQEQVDGGSIDDLQSSVADYRQKFEAARHTVADLVLTLNVPPEVSSVEPSKGLYTADLQAYWPFFEAKREREHMQQIAERLQMRLIQEQVDAALQANQPAKP